MLSAPMCGSKCWPATPRPQSGTSAPTAMNRRCPKALGQGEEQRGKAVPRAPPNSSAGVLQCSQVWRQRGPQQAGDKQVPTAGDAKAALSPAASSPGEAGQVPGASPGCNTLWSYSSALGGTALDYSLLRHTGLLLAAEVRNYEIQKLLPRLKAKSAKPS